MVELMIGSGAKKKIQQVLLFFSQAADRIGAKKKIQQITDVLDWALRRRWLNRLPSRRYLTEIPLSCRKELRAYSATAVMKMLKMTGASTQPCLTPTCTEKNSELAPPWITCADISSWKLCRIARKIGGQPNLDRGFHRIAWSMESHAFERSINAI